MLKTVTNFTENFNLGKNIKFLYKLGATKFNINVLIKFCLKLFLHCCSTQNDTASI
uniref:Uncharacterized protein n=1 Tax=Rhizophora mucronata TaxID=61149 RepID=A0A2P2L053_RHIMU